MKRFYPCPPWPEGGYSDWPAVATVLKDKFKLRFDFLAADLFQDAFWLTKQDEDRTNATRRLSLVLILDKNLPFVWSSATRVGLISESDLEEILSEVAVACIDLPDSAVDEILCNWHDVNEEGQWRAQGRRRIMRRMIQKVARKLAATRQLTMDTQVQGEIVSSKQEIEPMDNPLMAQAFREIFNESDQITRQIAELRKAGMILHAISEKIELCVATIQRRLEKFKERVRRRYEDLRREEG